MPDAKSLLPGRAFRSEHAQLRPEPHSIASHGPAPMDPLQTTRMRNGVLYAAEWPCCHDPLRLSLGSEDPFYIHNPRVRRARLRTPPPGCARPPRAPSACASPARGGGARTRRARRARAPGWGCAQPRAPNAWVVNVKRIFGTKAEPQRIVATRPLCRVQHPVPHSSRLQGIHRGGPVTCDRVRLRPKLGVLAAECPSR